MLKSIGTILKTYYVEMQGVAVCAPHFITRLPGPSETSQHCPWNLSILIGGISVWHCSIKKAADDPNISSGNDPSDIYLNLCGTSCQEFQQIVIICPNRLFKPRTNLKRIQLKILGICVLQASFIVFTENAQACTFYQIMIKRSVKRKWRKMQQLQMSRSLR